MVSFEHKTETAWLQIQRSGRNGQRDWCMAGSHRDYLRSVIIIDTRTNMELLIITDNAMPTKPSDKNARELKLANA